MSKRALALGALFLIAALSPSVVDLWRAHTSDPAMKPVVWGWVALAMVSILLAGEELLGAAA